MVIGPDFVFLAVPRTASVTLSHHWLHHYGGVLQPANLYHANVVPEEHRHKFTFAVVRNPYARVRSLWQFIQTFNSTKPYEGSLDDFPEWLIHAEGVEFLSQYAFLSASRLDRVLRYEDLEAGLRGLPFVDEWRPLTVHNSAAQVEASITEKFRAGVRQYEGQSFERYGYSRE